MISHSAPVRQDTPILGQMPSRSRSPFLRPGVGTVRVAVLCLGSMLWGCVGQRPLDSPAPLVQPARSTPQKPPAKATLPKKAMTAEAVQTGAPKPVARPVGAGRSETMEEVALLQGELLLSQGMVQEAWQQWSSVARGSEAPAGAVYEDAGWRRLFESYFKHGDRDNTPRFLQEIAEIEPTASQSRLLQGLLVRQPKDRLLTLLQAQPPHSPLIPTFQQALSQPALFGGPETALPTVDAELPVPPPEIAAPPAASPSLGEIPETGLKVGVLLPLSGKWTSMGEHLRRAAKKALADHPTVPIQLLIADSGDTAETSRKGILELVAQQVDVVVGPVFYPTVQPAVEVAVAQHIPIITLNPQRESDPATPGVFSNAFQPEQQAKIMARYAVLEKKYARIAILAPDSEYGRSVAKTFGDEVQSLGGAITRTQHFPQDTADFSAWLKPMGTQYDALFLPAPAKQVRLIAPQSALFRAGKAPLALLGTSLWNSPELLSEGTEYMEGAIFCDIDAAAKEPFRQSFRQTWEEDPSPLATLTYDGVSVVAQVLKEQQQGGIAWQETLTRKPAFQGAIGPLRFLPNGQSRRVYHLFQVEKGQIRALQPFQDSLAIP